MWPVAVTQTPERDDETRSMACGVVWLQREPCTWRFGQPPAAGIPETRSCTGLSVSLKGNRDDIFSDAADRGKGHRVVF